MNTAPDLADWRNLHPDERLESAAYGNEYETQGLWCAASTADFLLPGGFEVTRRAFFYIPPEKPADTLPRKPRASLVQQCRLLALWYEVKNPASAAELATSVSADLSVSLGSADQPPRFKKRDGDWGSGYWSPYLVWEHNNRRIVLAVDPGGPSPTSDALATRLLVIVRSSLAPRGLSFDWSGYDAPKGQPALMGSAETDSVARLENPCSFDDGHNNWQAGAIRLGEKLLRDFPATRWKSYIHLTLARTYAAMLILTYPSIDLNGANKPSSPPDTLRRDAVAHFRAFLEESPESPEVKSARKEAWRLLAGLPPSPIHFACTD